MFSKNDFELQRTNGQTKGRKDGVSELKNYSTYHSTFVHDLTSKISTKAGPGHGSPTPVFQDRMSNRPISEEDGPSCGAVQKYY